MGTQEWGKVGTQECGDGKHRSGVMGNTGVGEGEETGVRVMGDTGAGEGERAQASAQC